MSPTKTTIEWFLVVLRLLAFLASLSAKAASELKVNVRDYGAKGDGLSDDTAAIRASLAAVPVSGGTVYLPCGSYLTSSGQTITTSHTTITSEGTCAIFKMTGSNGFVALMVRGRGLSGPAILPRDASSNTFTVGTGELMALGITEGSYAIVSDKAVASNGPNLSPIETQEVVKITGVNGDAVTIEGNFVHNVTLPSFQNPFFSLNVRNGSTKSSVSASKIGSNQSSDVVRFSRK